MPTRLSRPLDSMGDGTSLCVRVKALACLYSCEDSTRGLGKLVLARHHGVEDGDEVKVQGDGRRDCGMAVFCPGEGEGGGCFFDKLFRLLRYDEKDC